MNGNHQIHLIINENEQLPLRCVGNEPKIHGDINEMNEILKNECKRSTWNEYRHVHEALTLNRRGRTSHSLQYQLLTELTFHLSILIQLSLLLTRYICDCSLKTGHVMINQRWTPFSLNWCVR